MIEEIFSIERNRKMGCGDWPRHAVSVRDILGPTPATCQGEGGKVVLKRGGRDGVKGGPDIRGRNGS